MNRTPLLLDIKGNSLDDGPGIRSVVFMKGCPLSCVWCHNPESKQPGPELSYDSTDCISCNECISVCSKGAINKSHEYFIDRSRCDLCFDCVEACPSGALSRVGNSVTTMDILENVLRDKPFYDTSGGGVTLSGGEPTLNMEFCSDLLKRLKQKGIHTLIETCGLFEMGRFEQLILPYADTIYFDIKLIQPGLHKTYCGVDNSLILRNFETLINITGGNGAEVLPRTPLVPGITATDTNIREIAEFLSGLNVTRMSLMEYNPLWLEKPMKIGVSTPFSSDTAMREWMNTTVINRLKDSIRQSGIELV